MENRLKVFISYASEDYKTAKKLYDDLKKAGAEPWLDKKNLQVGQDWKQTIPLIIKGCSYFLLLISKNSVSNTGFIQKEQKIALDILDEFPPGKIFIIPARLDNTEPLYEKLTNLYWADFVSSYENGLEQILDTLNLSYKKQKLLTWFMAFLITLTASILFATKFNIIFLKFTKINTKEMVKINKLKNVKIGKAGNYEDDGPEHIVNIDSFWIDEHEVTVDEYIKYCNNNKIAIPPDPEFKTMPNYFGDIRWRNYPVVNITWYEANEYCKSLGKQLPTEAQWEVSARYCKEYQEISPFVDKDACPTGNFPDKTLLTYYPAYKILNFNAKDTFPFTSPVKFFNKNKNGIYDLDGNVSEYCLDTYSKNFYAKSPIDNPVNREMNSNECIVRGPSWCQWNDVVSRNKKNKNQRFAYIGFRCVYCENQ